MNREKVRLALSILSGKISTEELSNSEWTMLGYDPDTFAPGPPDEARARAVEIILEAICDHYHVASWCAATV
jgi:hypothetical protein